MDDSHTSAEASLKNVMVRARIDARTVDDATMVLCAMGLTISDVIRIVLKRVAADQALPVELISPSPAMLEAAKAARAPKGAKAA